jgi:mycothiol synthase
MSTPTVVAVPPSGFSDLLEAARRIDDEVAARTGHPALGDAVWRDFAQPGPDSLGLLIDDIAFAHVARSDTFAPQHWTVGLALTPDTRRVGIAGALVDAAIAHVAAHGGGHVVLWVFAATDEDDALLAPTGLKATRGLYEMRVPLPRPEPIEWPDGIEVRDFEPGRDEAAWLVVNNRAFENHPDQGDWVEATLARREAEPWFDPSIFVLAFDEEGLAGYNWCKIHPAEGDRPALGEIFVIGVDPRMAGKRLGRPLALEGLRRLAQRGLHTGSLFTASDNTRAQKLYHDIGFTDHRIDRAYERDVDPA